MKSNTSLTVDQAKEKARQNLPGVGADMDLGRITAKFALNAVWQIEVDGKLVGYLDENGNAKPRSFAMTDFYPYS
jgi:hypothetical protein